MQKTAIITGASRGIGKGIALMLAEMGYRLALIAKNERLLQEVAEFITKKHQLSHQDQPLVVVVDVTNTLAVENAISGLLKKMKSVDILINAAGIVKDGTSEISTEDFQEMLQVNLVGCFNFIHAIAPQMKKQQFGYIFNIASMAGKRGGGTLGGYCASKFGLVGFSESLFNELAEYRIRVTAVCPSFVDTEMTANIPMANADKIPVEDICKTIRFLLSLSPSSAVKEVMIDCRKLVESSNSASKQLDVFPAKKVL